MAYIIRLKTSMFVVFGAALGKGRRCGLVGGGMLLGVLEEVTGSVGGYWEECWRRDVTGSGP